MKNNDLWKIRGRYIYIYLKFKIVLITSYLVPFSLKLYEYDVHIFIKEKAKK